MCFGRFFYKELEAVGRFLPFPIRRLPMKLVHFCGRDIREESAQLNEKRLGREGENGEVLYIAGGDSWPQRIAEVVTEVLTFDGPEVTGIIFKGAITKAKFDCP
jgi:hypothetical protein